MSNINKEIENMQRIINSKDYLMDKYFTPNRKEFRKISCINTITALYLSENYLQLKDFINIAKSEFNMQDDINNFDDFHMLAVKYCYLMETYVNAINS